jgi:hypothetical protein
VLAHQELDLLIEEAVVEAAAVAVVVVQTAVLVEPQDLVE